MISFVFLQMNLIVAPYCTKSLNKCQTISLTAQFFALFVGIMIHVTAGTEQQAIDAGTETSSMGAETLVVNTVILISNIAVVVFPLSLLFDKDSMESSYWRFREKIDNISCWKKSKIKKKQAPVIVSNIEVGILPEARLQCDIVKILPTFKK
jgi:hypothetical protein